MDDDFLRALNKFNAKFCYNNKKNSIREINETKEKSHKVREVRLNKLKEDLELHYIHNSNNKICQKFLTLPLSKKCDKLNKHSDKVILPVSILKTLEKGSYSNEVEHPYTFSIKNLQNNYITHACVLEFSSNEGIVLVSENIKENLGITETNGITRLLVTYANLPKCDFIKFESLNENVRDIKFMKNLLENQLSLNYSTLSLGDYVHINHLNFYISELEPDNAVSLINTDINVDICEVKSLNEQNISKDNNNNFYEIVTTDTLINSTIKNEMKKYKFVINYNILELLKKDKANIKISLNSNKLSDINIFLSFPPYDQVSDVIHHLYFDDFSKEITINKDIIKKCLKIHFICFLKEDDNNFLEYIFDHFFPHIIYIAISNTNESELQYSLSLKIDYDIPLKGDIDNYNKIKDEINDETCNKNSLNELKENSMISSTYVKCDNCLKEILENNLDIHKIHCIKNISICNICKKVLKKKEIIEHIHCDICNEGLSVINKNRHNYIWHTKIKCLCEKYFYRKQFIFHQKLFCPKKIIYCIFCNIFTESSMNIYNEDYIIASFFDKFDNNDFSVKSIDYYSQLIYNNFNYFLKYINNTEHERYCGSKSVSCIICKNNIYRNKYMSHLNLIHNNDKIKSFKIINENIDVNEPINN
ncbi:ubiquitin fusion degradation protein UFD1, putative [Plasmodium gallinaceum]|uniref:Ubiquitin fusion degradation protein UFD1, putative n=1 Tax=Plasmodium gallinaceum TaxID=5849 RepID=A0A1J1GKT3_PLAGA|nr:ubiquitin fusion degradation protein UFD1, putative [Plasmodium gallinaceum]CRG93016.1 ubiquitin fusion degradation protein UFD1, putative [Plasmodium gallinaceum]